MAVARRAGGTGRPEQLLAAAGVATCVLLFAGQEAFRRAEASVCAVVVSLLRVEPAQSIGTAVIFPTDSRWVGFTVAPSCTAALLVVPFVLLTGLLLLARRVPPARALSTVAAFAAVVIVVNQLRLLVIALSIRVWGWPSGFENSHVLLGTVVSTIGVAGGLLLFLRMIVPKEGERRV